MIDFLCDHAKGVIPILLTATTGTGLVALWWLKKYIRDQDAWRQAMTAKLDEALRIHYECQAELAEKFIQRSDFMQFMQMRSAEHALINNRLQALENQQAALLTKLDVFMDDQKTKQERMSTTFLAREEAISKRIDKLVDNHKAGVS